MSKPATVKDHQEHTTHVSKTTPQELRRFGHARLLNRVKYHLRFHNGKGLSPPFYDQLFLAPIRNREEIHILL